MSKEFKDANEFKEFFEEFRKKDSYKDPVAFGIARVDRGQKNSDKILQASYAVMLCKSAMLRLILALTSS